MTSSLLKADLELEEQERRLTKCLFGVIIPFIAPVALGVAFPVIALLWFALAAAVTVLVGSNFLGLPIFLLTLLISYLLLSLLVWMGMNWVDKKRFRRKVRAK